MFELRTYVTVAGVEVFSLWHASMKDKVAAAKIAARLGRLTRGNFGDHKPVGDGVWELRVDHGPGYRVYYAVAEKTVILLLCGGDKRKQAADIERARKYWSDFKRRAKDEDESE